MHALVCETGDLVFDPSGYGHPVQRQQNWGNMLSRGCSGHNTVEKFFPYLMERDVYVPSLNPLRDHPEVILGFTGRLVPDTK